MQAELSETQVAASLNAFYKLRNRPTTSPTINNKTVQLTKLFVFVHKQGGNEHCNWETCSTFLLNDPVHGSKLKELYMEYLVEFEEEFKQKDPLDEFYKQDAYKVKSYKVFDGNMIFDRCSPLPMKELQAFLASRQYGFSTITFEKWSKMKNPLTDPHKIQLLHDLGWIDALTLFKMLESGIYDEVQQAMLLLNLCSLEPQLDMNLTENTEIYTAVCENFKFYINALLHDVDWQLDALTLIELVNIFLKTFSNWSKQKELHALLLTFPLLDHCCILGMYLLNCFQTLSNQAMFISIHSKTTFDVEHSILHTMDMQFIPLCLETLYLISCVCSQLGNTMI